MKETVNHEECVVEEAINQRKCTKRQIRAKQESEPEEYRPGMSLKAKKKKKKIIHKVNQPNENPDQPTPKKRGRKPRNTLQQLIQSVPTFDGEQAHMNWP